MRKQVLAIGTPVLWWGGVVRAVRRAGLLADQAGLAIRRTDRRRADDLAAVVPYDDRQIFFYYAISIIPFTVIAVTLCSGRSSARPGRSYPETVVGTCLSRRLVAIVAMNFIYFYPILTDRLLTNAEWNDRMWLTHWL